MKNTRKCTLSTFWLGYKDWLKERLGKKMPEVMEEIRQEHGRNFPLRLTAYLILAVFLLIALAAVIGTVAKGSLKMGATSEHLMTFSVWVTVILVCSAVGIWFGITCFKVQRFCHEMCERGHRILEAQPA